MKFLLAPAIALFLSGCASLPPEHDSSTDPVAGASLKYLPSLRGDYFSITAAESNRAYHIYVRLPEGYDAARASSYPVIYVLDGDSLFPLLSPTHFFVHNDEQVPDAVLVGIGYGSFDPAVNRRNVDFSAPGRDSRPGEDGAPRFLSFLKTQLIPEVERRYRVNPQRRVLIGQSRAGFFVLWSALRDPALFWASIASNASFAPANETLFQVSSERPAGPRYMAVVSGTRDTQARMQSAIEWTQYWRSDPQRPWEIRHFVLQDGTHAASIGQAYRDVMVWLFSDEIAASKAAAVPR